MRQFISLMALVTAAYLLIQSGEFSVPGFSQPTNSTEQLLEDAVENRRSNLQVQGEGIVIKILADDLDGSRHQRFLIRLISGQTLLISHNIDLAPRINQLQEGDLVMFYGEYEWNSQGGIIDWTHHDPKGSHVDGWLKHEGQIYQ